MNNKVYALVTLLEDELSLDDITLHSSRGAAIEAGEEVIRNIFFSTDEDDNVSEETVKKYIELWRETNYIPNFVMLTEYEVND